MYLGRTPNWSDAIYLSEDDQWDINDPLIDKVRVFDSVESGESYSRTVIADLPGVATGDYHVIVRSDIRNHVYESEESNNFQVSAEQININTELLELGGSDSDTIRPGKSIYYRLEVSAGQAIRIKLDSQIASSSNNVYVRYGQMPTKGQFDFFTEPFTASPELVFPAEQDGTYYVLVTGDDSSAASNFTITAEEIPFSLLNVSTKRVGNVAPFTLELEGAKFNADNTDFQIVDGLGTIYEATQVVFKDSTTAYATFDLSAQSVGNYDVRAIKNDGTSVILEDVLIVEEGIDAQLFSSIDGPGLVRPGGKYFAKLNYANAGGADEAAPLIILQTPDTSLGLSADSIVPTESLFLLGIGEDLGADILRAGEINQIPFFFTPGGSVNVNMLRYTEDSSTPITEADWNLIETAIKPSEISEEDWSEFWSPIQPRIGNTWGDYVQVVNDLAQAFSPEAERDYDVRELFAEWYESGDLSVYTPKSFVSGRLIDTDTGEPLSNVELEFYQEVDEETIRIVDRVLTDTKGAFSFTTLAPGEYKLVVLGDYSFENYSDSDISNQIVADSIENVVDSKIYSDTHKSDTQSSYSSPNSFESNIISNQIYSFNINPGNDISNLELKTNLSSSSSDSNTVDPPLSQEVVEELIQVLSDPNSSIEELNNILLQAENLSDNTEFPATQNSQLPSPPGTPPGLPIPEERLIYWSPKINLPDWFPINGGKDLQLILALAYTEDFVQLSDKFVFSALGVGTAQLQIGEDIRGGAVEFSYTNTRRKQNCIWVRNEDQIKLSTGVIVGTSKAGSDFVTAEPFRSIIKFVEEKLNTSISFTVVDTFLLGGSATYYPQNGDIKGAITFDFAREAYGLIQLGESYLQVSFKARGGANLTAYPNIGLPGLEEFSATIEILGKLPDINIPGLPEIEGAAFGIQGTISSATGWKIKPIKAPPLPPSEPPLLPPGSGSTENQFVENIQQDSNTKTISSLSELFTSPESFFDIPEPPEIEDCEDDHDEDDGDLGDYNPAVLVSRDPNDILGPEGFGKEKWIDAEEPLEYTIRFENDPELATAPAQVVRITQQLDEDLDFRTFRLGDFGFGNTFIDVPDNRAFYQTRLDLVADKGIYVDFFAGIDIVTGEAFWELRSIDPATGEQPNDPLLGFLPPNLTKPEGDGFVNYSIRTDRDIETGAVIDAEARIIFDINEPIDTPPIFNTIDAVKPTSTIEALPDLSDSSEFIVSWTGDDDTNGSAIANYTIYVAENDGEYTPWLENTTLTEALFTGTPGDSYQFYAVARDNAGNVEDIALTSQAQTTIAGGNNPPLLLNPLDDLVIDENSNFSFTISDNVFIDTDAGDVLNYSAKKADGTPLPLWLNFDGANQTFTGTPVSEDVGIFEIEVTATDNSNEIATDLFTLKVQEVVQQPVFSTIGEFGKVSNFNHHQQTIEFNNSYDNPVVFALPLSGRGKDPATVRITDLQSDGFTAYLQEPEYKDGWHTTESFSYLVLEAGDWVLSDGTLLEVDNIDTNRLTNKGWENLEFDLDFESTPAILSQVQTYNGNQFVRTRQKGASVDGFSLSMEEEEALKHTGHLTETVGWLAMETGTGVLGDIQYQAGHTERTVDHQGYTLEFEAEFDSTPYLFASLASFYGGDSAGLRYKNLTNDQVRIVLEEEQSLDAETAHVDEIVDFIAISGDGDLLATAYVPNELS